MKNIRTFKRSIPLLFICLSLCIIVPTKMVVADLTPDLYETNDSMATVYWLLKGSYQMSIHSISDVDYFNITLGAGETGPILGWNVSEYYIYVNVFDPTGYQISYESAGSSYNASIIITAGLGGDYCIGISSSYVLTYNLDIIGDDTREDNDNFGQAFEIYGAMTIDAKLLDDDYWKYILDAGMWTINLSLISAVDPYPSMQWILFDASTIQIDSGYVYEIGSIVPISIFTPIGGEYYLKVTSYEAVTAYSIESSCIADDYLEDNDVFGSASIIGSIPYSITSLALLDVDIFKFTLGVGGSVEINITAKKILGASSSAGIDIDVLYENLTTALCDMYGSYSYMDVDEPVSLLIFNNQGVSQIYYLVLNCSEGDYLEEYNIGFYTVQDDIYEENDLRSQAYPITNAQAMLMDKFLLDDDWYQITITGANETLYCILGIMDRAAARVSAAIDIVNAEGILLAESRILPIFMMNYRVVNVSITTSGIYYIHIYSPGNTPFKYAWLYSELRVFYPNDISQATGTVGNGISWLISDSLNNMGTTGPTITGFAEIYRDGKLIANKTWSKTVPLVTVSTDGLAAGEYTYLVVVKNILDPLVITSVTDVVIVTVTGGTDDTVDTEPTAFTVDGYGIFLLSAISLVTLSLLRKRLRVMH